MRYMIIIGMICFFWQPLFGQVDDLPGKINWGKEYKEPSGSYISKLIHSNKDGFYVLRRKGAGLINNEKAFVEYFDKDMNLKRSTELSLKYKTKDRQFEDVLVIGGELYFFTSFNNQAKKKNYLFYQKISKRLTLSKKLVMIQEIDSRNKYRGGAFDIEISKDSSKVLLYSQLPYDKKEPERFALKVFDNQLQELWSKEISLPYGDNQFSVEEYRIDKQGNVYISGIVYTEGVRLKRQGMPAYYYVVLTYTNEGTEVNEYRINSGDKFITDLTFRPGNKGEIICAGFYSEMGLESIKGACFFRINSRTKEVLQSSYKAFDFDFITEYLPKWRKNAVKNAEEKGKEKRAGELFEFSLDELILRSDGGAVLVAEQFYVYQEYYRDWNGMTYTRNYYHYNDVIVVNIQPTGEIEWQARIPKRQISVDDGGFYASYAMAVVRDKMYFIYNENTRNIYKETRKNPRSTNPGRYSVVALTELSKDGEVKTYPLFLNKDTGIVTRPKICDQNGRKKMLVYGESGRRYKFAELLFD